MKEKQKLNITFHNPNTNEEVIKVLIGIAAELVLDKVTKIIIDEREQG